MTGHAQKVLVVWWVLAASLVGFLALMVAVQLGWTSEIDRRLLLGLRNPLDRGDAWGPVWFEEAAAELTALGGYPVIVLMSALVLVGLLIMRKFSASVFLLAALIGGSIASTALKQVFERPRPDLVDHLDRTFTSSFPSAHAMMGMVAWLTLAAIVIRFVEHRRLHVFVLSSALILAVIIGASRVYLGVHWPSDVLAGWCIGIAWASGSWLAAHYLARRPDRIGEFGRSE